jgi:hypothetical protein
MRASIASEMAGIPSVSLICEGFEGQARATGRGFGFDDLAIATTAGHVDAQSFDEMVEKFMAGTFEQVIDGLTRSVTQPVDASTEPSALEICATGTVEEINRVFIAHEWSDGLPIIPPTKPRVDAMIELSGHDPWKVLGIAKSSGRDITVWSIAVNAVMAGCSPEHLPLLIAVAEILADPRYGAEHSGNTTGADALMIMNGPSADELGFNSGQGALRDGVHANTSVGRWLRLYLRNVFGFVPGEHDKATFGNTFRVVLTEDQATLEAIDWEPVSADFGFARSDDVITMARMNSGLIIGSVFGSTPEEIIPYLADGMARVSGWDLTHVYGIGQDQFRPLLVLSPILARTFAKAGWSKHDVKQALFDQARIPASRFEKLIGEWSNLTAGRRTLVDLVAEGDLPGVFAVADDPDRLVPIVTEPCKFVVAVAGDPNRANAYAFSNDGPHGDYTARLVDYTSATDLVCAIPPPPNS